MKCISSRKSALLLVTHVSVTISLWMLSLWVSARPGGASVVSRPLKSVFKLYVIHFWDRRGPLNSPWNNWCPVTFGVVSILLMQRGPVYIFKLVGDVSPLQLKQKQWVTLLMFRANIKANNIHRENIIHPVTCYCSTRGEGHRSG